MPERRTKRFSLEVRSVTANAVHDDVFKVQRYLMRFGYLHGPFEPKRLDVPTQQALRLLQGRANISQTGVIDPPTVAILEMPRCGVPDLFIPGGTSEAYSLRGCSFEAIYRTLLYAFVVDTPDMAGSDEKQAIRNAFATWQNEIPIDFAEVGMANNPNFSIGWFTGDHGDGAPFDGVGNVVAHAFFPPPCGGTHAGKCHFDDAENWGTSFAGGRTDVETVALHEFGHLLGLKHSTVNGAIMFPFINGMQRALAQDDIQGIQAIYGKRGPALEVLVHLAGIADLSFRENEFAGTRGQARRLEGFQLEISPAVAGLSMRYMAHLQGIGDVPFVNEGQFIGTRGEARRLEGFAIELTGTAAANYRVAYMAHLQGTGDTGVCYDGQFCGTRGEARRVEGILVRVEPK